MGCWFTRTDLSICTSWNELNAKIKIFDDHIAKERYHYESIQPEFRTPTDKELLYFYRAYMPWDPSLVEGKVFDKKIAELVDKYYKFLDGEKTSTTTTLMEEVYIEVQKEISEINNLNTSISIHDIQEF